jgi:hypothetical protein
MHHQQLKLWLSVGVLVVVELIIKVAVALVD